MVLEKCVIGIEFGSTNIKAVMLDENHEIIASNDYAWESTLKNGIWIYTLEQAKIGLADCYAGLKKKFETKLLIVKFQVTICLLNFYPST